MKATYSLVAVCFLLTVFTVNAQSNDFVNTLSHLTYFIVCKYHAD